MNTFCATKYNYNIISQQTIEIQPFPYLRDDLGSERILCVSPIHGRSFVVNYTPNLAIVSKGNGLSYTSKTFLNTKEYGEHSWGLLLKKDAIRDFNLGNEVNQLGIKTNIIQYVLELDYLYPIPGFGDIKPVLLQYSVECPYRICDFAFTPKNVILHELKKWEACNKFGYKKKHLIATDVMVSNLRTMHNKNILHNAIHNQNYTWALELLDFELARSNTYPYENENYEQEFPILFEREIIQTYEIVNYIAWCLKETIDFKEIEEIFNIYNYKI